MTTEAKPAVVTPSDGSGFDPMPKLKELLSQPPKGEEKPAAPAPAPAPAPKPTPPKAAEPTIRGVRETPKPIDEVVPPAAAAPSTVMAPPADVLPQAGAETPAPVAPAAGELPADDDAPPEVATQPQARSKWTLLKGENKSLKSKVAELETAVKEAAKVKPPELEEMASMKKQIEDYEQRIGQLDLGQSKAFQERFDKPLMSIYTRGVALLQRAGKSEKAAHETMGGLLRASLMPNPENDPETGEPTGESPMGQMQALLADVPMNVQGALTQQVFDMADLQQQRNAALQDWQTTRAGLSESERRLQTADLSKGIVEDTERAVKDLVDENSWIFMESDSDQNWNQQRDGMIRAARHVLRDGKSPEIVKYVMEGIAAARYRAWGEQEHARAEKLAAELAARVGRVPGVGAGGGIPSGEPAPAPAVEKGKPLDPQDWLAKNFPPRR